MTKVIAKCYNCGSNRIVNTKVQTFKCMKCNKSINYDKAKILCKPTDNDKELQNKIGNLRSKNNKDNSDDFSVSNFNIGNNKHSDPHKYILKILKKEEPIERESLEFICTQTDAFTEETIKESINNLERNGKIYKVPTKGLKRV